MQAALVIQTWYRRYRARLRARQHYALAIFQSVEYADEQGQMQVCLASTSLFPSLPPSLPSSLALSPLLVGERMKLWVWVKLRNLDEMLS